MRGKKKLNIAVVNSSSFGMYFPEHIERLTRLGKVKRFEFPPDIDGKSLAKRLKGYSVIIASVSPRYDEEFFANKDETLLITRHGIGYDNIDVESATKKGVIVTKVQGEIEREAVAEMAIALLMAVMRRLMEASLAVKIGRWRERARFIGWEIRGKNVGIIGFGNIGSRVGEILKNGFSANVLAYDPFLSEEEIRNKGAKPVSLEELLGNSDIISLNASLNPENYHMLSFKEFSLMKEGAILVNTARGELIDEEALLDALEKGKVAGVGLDVVEGEPIDKNHPLLRFENVIITPHTSAYTYECLRAMGEKVVCDVERVAKGEIPEEVINEEVLGGKWRA